MMRTHAYALKGHIVKLVRKLIALTLALVGIGFGLTGILHGHTIDILMPKGQIALQERNLILFTLALSLVVVVPVFAMLILFAVRYREGRAKPAQYRPDWDGNRLLETIWWGVPCLIILVLGITTWITTHQLDPYKKLASTTPALNVQVVALQWKWLFIYPDLHVASVNLLPIPEKTPVNFSITSDAPMNSFWIPSLGSQVYAMSGMSTKLSLIADTTGDFKGSSSNISGTGFADMHFIARAMSRTDFDGWVHTAQSAPRSLTYASYQQLQKPASVATPLTYRLQDDALYDTIVMKYMMPPQDNGSVSASSETSAGHGVTSAIGGN